MHLSNIFGPRLWAYLLPLLVSHTAFSWNDNQSISLVELDNSSSTQLPTGIANNNSSSSSQYTAQTRNGLLLPGEANIDDLLPASGQLLPPPFGANLFAGGYETERYDGLNEDYLIAAGDKLSIWLWGGLNLSEVVTVDNQGNIFLPNIGPINVSNTPASKVNQLVTNKIRTIYKENVEIYVNLLTSTPVSVYVSGNVIRPGQYAGIASDSVLYYLKRAGGIDPERGSYRKINILRQGKIIKKIDLYEFLQSGKIAQSNFKDGDVILVSPQLPTIAVTGTVKNPFRFEVINEQLKGNEIIKLADPYAKVSHVGIVGTRNNSPFSTYLDLVGFDNFKLQDGDQLIFNDDLRAQILDIQVQGSYLGPSYYAVSKNTKLHDFLAKVPIEKSLTDYQSVYLLRKSVAKKQKELIEESLQRLERSIFTAPASSDGEAAIRAKEAEMILAFTAKARKINTLGKVIVSSNGKVADVLLEQGDTVVIPGKNDLIQIGGEVQMPQAFVFNSQADIEDYVAWAGGYTERANFKRPLIVKANGEIASGNDFKLQAGDQILILPKIDNKNMQAIKDITQIIYQIAVAANVVIK